MKQKKRPQLSPILIAGIITLIAIGGVLLYQKQNIPSSTTQTYRSSPSVIDETTNSETYESTDHNFSFKYPKEWKVSNTGSTVTISNGSSNIGFQVSPYPSIDFDKLYEKADGAVNQNPVFIRTKIKNLDIGGYKATMYINESTPGNQNKSFDISVYIVRGAPITMISGNSDPSSKESLLSTFNQIVSTIKFTK